ncbi:MAG TPA: SEFIR domain-containing protein [Micromonosporaceae bacterium]
MRGGTIITFYSYKGGTGRSMAVANTAWILASNGQRVLAVDWDLEAPGLHRYFHPFLADKDLRLSRGIVDLVWDFAAAAVDSEAPNEPGWHEKFAEISPYAMSLEYEFPGKGTVDFVPAGRQDSSYSTLVSSFDWENFYDRLGGGGFLEALKRNMRERYDYVLIDSRTGLSDTAGICTVQLPDVLVNCFSLSTQAIDGAAAVAASVGRQRRDGQVRIFPVPMRVEDGEQDKLDASRDYARSCFGRFLSHVANPERYWGEVEVPYKSFYAYEEILATVGDRPHQENTILSATERIVGYLTDQRVTELQALPSESERRALLALFQRGAKTVRGTTTVPGADVHIGGVTSRVFISYAYESAEHFEAVRELWFLLRSRGVDARMDLPPNQRQSGWSGWLMEELRAADLVLVVLSPTYKRFADREAATADDRGPGPEAFLLRDAYRSGLATRRILPVVLPGGSAADTPEFLSDTDPAVVADLTVAGIDSLLRKVLWQGQHREGGMSSPPPAPTGWYSERSASSFSRTRVLDALAAGERQRALRVLNDPWPLPVRWSVASRHGLASSPVRGQRLQGSADDLVETYLGLLSGQLIVVGAPGSGKSTVTSRIIHEMLTGWDGGPVPILLPAASWLPDIEPLDSWIIRHLQQNYFGPDLEPLIAAGLIVPVVDGLDELPNFLRGMALQALSRSSLPMVVTCRTEEYLEVVATTGRPPPGAVVVELEPLNVEDVIRYLTDSTVDEERWSPVFAHLRRYPADQLAKALSTPAALRMARSAYSKPDTDPAQLTDRTRFPNRMEIEEHLLDSFIPAVYAPRPPHSSSERVTEPVYDPAWAHRWLTFLACWMRENDTHDLAWWHLHRAIPVLTGRFLFGLVGGWFAATVLVIVDAFLGLPTVTFLGQVPVEVITGFSLGVFAAVLARPPSRPSSGLRVGAPITYRQWLLRQRRPADLSRHPNPRASLRAAWAATMVAGLWWGVIVSGGVATVTTSVGISPPELRVQSAAVLAVGVMLFHLNTSAWGWYTVARLWLAMRRSLPWRLMRFLDDAHDRGVLRQEGPVYQFRHALIRDRLAVRR